MTEKHTNIYTALANAQLQFGKVEKGSVNPAFKSKYADLSDVASVVIPTLAGHGVCVLQYFVRDDLSAMRTEFHHGESMTRVYCDVPLIVDRNNMQGMKSATTYAKRIGLESLSGVAPEDDDGMAAVEARPVSRQAAKPSAGSKATTDRIIAEASRPQSPATPSERADKMIDALKAKGLSVSEQTTFQTALDALRKASPEDAARVEFTVQELTPNANADIDGDSIPY